ncbi:low temperature-induced protein [Paenibacillus spiritus]|uniref:Low temperature-induced protein n=1 Tax=Paenibacillus spiritus TaxID=2496557 RepID=A0A5J5G8W1_9BACL|nr:MULTISPECIES: general stress protein [Paenibacillus]KAA9004157.1 low temperature-induced protein [Paenibacillus spiritus]
MTRKIVGVFDREQEATHAIQALQAKGVPSDDISVVTRERDDLREITKETGTMAPEGVATGAATGGVVGGVAGLLAGIGALAIPGIGPILAAGPIAAALTGAAVGAGAGGLVGGLIGLGIPEDEAKEYESYVDNGKILVLVDDKSGERQVYDVFRTHGSLNADRYAPIDQDPAYTPGMAAGTGTPLTDRGPTNPGLVQDETMAGNTLGNRGAMNASVNPDDVDRNRY